MRTITFAIPDFVDLEQRDLTLFWGREVIGTKNRGEKIKVKVIRCNICGVCCFGSECAEKHLKFERVHHADGTVQEGWFCHFPGDRVPFSCCKGRGAANECCVRFEEVK